MEQTEAIGWVRNVLLLTGILSLAVGALFLRRTNKMCIRDSNRSIRPHSRRRKYG